MASVQWHKTKNRWHVQAKRYNKAGKRVRLSKLMPEGFTREQAEEFARALDARAMGEAHFSDPPPAEADENWEAAVKKARASKKSFFWRMMGNAKKRSTVRKHDLELTEDQLEALLLRSKGRCEVSGIPFLKDDFGARRLRPFVPTLDRRDSTAGYSLENCRIVCAAVNVAMFDWGEEAFLRMVAGTFYNRFVAPAFPVAGIAVGSHWASPVAGSIPFASDPRLTHPGDAGLFPEQVQ